MKPYVVAIVFARGGSKGVPRKNLRLLAGKPLIAYAVESALASKVIDRVVVSTDDLEIASIAKKYGAEVPFMRPSEIARDNSPEWLAWQHALRALSQNSDRKTEIFISVPPTAPLRAVGDLDACVLALQDSDADVVITVKTAERSPYFNMVCLNESGHAQLLMKPEGTIHRRQDAPIVYDITTVAYAARPDFVLNANSIFEGKVGVVVVPSERALDIDTEFDFQLAELLLSKSASAGIGPG